MRRQAAVFGDPTFPSSASKNRDRTDQEVFSNFVPLKRQARRSEIGGLPGDIGGFLSSPASSHRESEKPEGKGEETEDEPMYGIVSVMGRSRKMEDTVTVKPSLCRPEINRQKPVHFFAVYDGHGGSQVKEKKV